MGRDGEWESKAEMKRWSEKDCEREREEILRERERERDERLREVGRGACIIVYIYVVGEWKSDLKS